MGAEEAQMAARVPEAKVDAQQERLEKEAAEAAMLTGFSRSDARGFGGTALRMKCDVDLRKDLYANCKEHGVLKHGKFYGDNEDGTIQLMVGVGRKARQVIVALQDFEEDH